MCWIVKHQVFNNIPPICKYFPHCEACPAVNMSQQQMPGSFTADRILEPGEEIWADIKLLAVNGEAHKHKRVIEGYTRYALTAVNLAVVFKLGHVLKHTAY